MKITLEEAAAVGIVLEKAASEEMALDNSAAVAKKQEVYSPPQPQILYHIDTFY